MVRGGKETVHDSPQREDVEVLEWGEIFFSYRPKIEMEEAHSIDDVRRIYIVLRPEMAKKPQELKQSHESGKEGVKFHEKHHEKGESTAEATPDKGKQGGKGEEKVKIGKQPLYRFILLGRKTLPDPSKRTRPYWGFVELVTTDIEDVKKALGPAEYDTKTRGRRYKPEARPVGEGVYCIVNHKKGNQAHTHLVYKLELPRKEKPHSPQHELHIEDEASFIIQIKNPNQPAPPNIGLGNKRKATYPASLQALMGNYRFVPADPCDLLNYEGCEFILISASDDIEKELGLHLELRHDESCSEILKVFGKGPHTIKPLLEGAWA